MHAIYQDLILHQVDMVLGDACEGASPTHDLCRYSINIIVRELQKTTALSNFDFLLDSIILEGNIQDFITLTLTSEEFEKKQKAACQYKELAKELQYAIEKYGSEPFQSETIRRINGTPPLKTWKGQYPYYEKFGHERIAQGIYNQLITFEEHVKPFIDSVSTQFQR